MIASKRSIVLTSALLLTGACSGGSLTVQNPPAPPGFPTSTDRPPAHAAHSGPMNGDLPAALSSMSGQDLWDFVKNMQKGSGMTAARPCRNFFSCKLLGKKTNVEIIASKDARFQDAVNAGPNGTIVAIAENKGDYTTVRYEFKPNDANTRHVYAFVVYNKTATAGPTYVLTEITKTGGTYSHAEPNSADTFTLCNHPKEWDASAAAFQTCSGKMSKGVVSNNLVLMGMSDFGLARFYVKSVAALAMQFAEDDPPGWITCGAGCCTMGGLN